MSASMGSEWTEPIPFGKTRRPYGTGSIHWDEHGQRWIACVELPRQRHERRRRRRFTATTRAAVEAKLAAYHETFPPQPFPGRETYMEHARTLGTHTDAEWWALVRSVKKVCHYCGITTEAVWGGILAPYHLQKDHLVPVSRGGSDSIDNIVVSCRRCNEEKSTLTADEYRDWKAHR